MTRVLFGKRAVKKEKRDSDEIVYTIGTHVLGAFYIEKEDTIQFKLPNGKLGIVSKKGVVNDMETDDYAIAKRLVKSFQKDLYIELLILGPRTGDYECTFFTQKSIKVNSIVTGVIEGSEEVGYAVALGVPGKTALLKTDAVYTEGTLGVFQVSAVTPSTFLLHDKIDREIYLGDKDEVSPGVFVRTTITGRPKYILGQLRPKYTSMFYSYTAQGLSLGELIVESKKEMEEEDQQVSIILYVSEDKTTVHAVPYEEYTQEIHKKLPDPSMIGVITTGEIVSIKERGYASVRLEEGILAVLYQEHYSDISRRGSAAPFREGDTITVRVFDVRGYSVTVTAKESLIRAENAAVPLVPGTEAVVFVRQATDAVLKCSTFGRQTVHLQRAKDMDAEVGAVHRVYITKPGRTEGIFYASLALEEKQNLQKREEKEKERRELTADEKERAGETRAERRIEAVKKYKNGQIVSTNISRVYQYGAFADLDRYAVARIKIGEISSRYVEDWATLVHPGQKVNIVLYDIDYEAGLIEGSIKKFEVLNAFEGAPAEETQEKRESAHAEPVAYAVDAPEENSEDEESDSTINDENMQMELFNSKDGVEPWTKRMQNASPALLLKLFRQAMGYLQSPDAKMRICIEYATSLGDVQAERIEPEWIEPIEEGIRRDGSIFLKKVADATRTAKNRALFRMVCLRFIDEKRDSPFGYRELIHAAHKANSVEELREVSELMNKSEMKTADRKSVEMAHIEALYHVSKNEGRTAVEKQLSKMENRSREDWVMKYIALETGSIAKNADIIYTRNIFNRSVADENISESAVKSIFKMYLKFEKEYGTKDKEEAVLEKAKEYVAATSK
ncbi:hypothetical protein NEMIN01_0489 [Nematocida minor]|uniref:uncharacterized protein n=1 Tax=Nematocida minor TaxID=1912983 RepID=UPI00221FF3E0|nr:uncharacterized protein NEMIN01_0489 [Nematocida minor]KAI5189426.1 hypothetical protein NEMIN01_0489 [Nematocida minor]